MTNIVLLVKDRPRLTVQCLNTLYENTSRDQFTLTVMDDGSDLETTEIIGKHSRYVSNMRVIVLEQSIGIVGWLRNVGASASERYFGRGEYLCFIDNDIAFRANWLQKMIHSMECLPPHVKLLGGYRHPFHGVNAKWEPPASVEETDAVAGYMHFMEWVTWDTYGPYDQHSRGVCQSEDFAFCQKIVKDGGKVGYIHPSVILNCGITNSENKPAIGSEQFIRVEGYIYE